MSRGKIAPVLTRLVYGNGVSDPVNVEAERELRALLAVARAARPMLRQHGSAEWAALSRALDRLSRASTPKRRNGGGR